MIEPYDPNKSFKWIPDLTKIKEINHSDSNLKFYAVRAGHPTTTDPNNVGHGARRWTIEEKSKATRTLAYKPLNINHTMPITEGKNFVVDAEFMDGEEQAIIAVQDPEINKAIKEGIITHVSVQGKSREAPLVCEKGQCANEPRGTIYEALALIATKDFEYRGQKIKAESPGDPTALIKIIECNKKLQDNSAFIANITPNKTMNEQFRNILAKITQHNENLDSITSAINALADVPEDIKAQLLEAARQIYSAMEKNTPAAQAPVQGLAELKTQVEALSKTVSEMQDYSKNKMTEILNKTIDEKLASFKPAAPAAPTPATTTLEKLSDGELGKVLEAKLQSIPLSEMLARYERGN
jgi:hypothetical protein